MQGFAAVPEMSYEQRASELESSAKRIRKSRISTDRHTDAVPLKKYYDRPIEPKVVAAVPTYS